MVPWLIKVVAESKQLAASWYFPVDMQLVYSALGNMFTGYEGTPWYGWHYTAYLSLIILAFALFALTDKKNRKRTLLFIIFGALPLAIIIGISFVKPLFVNRYLIPATIAEVLVIVAALDAIKHPLLQKISAAVLLVFVIWINWWYPPQHPKVPLRDTLTQVNALVKPSDVILADNPLIYLETEFYAQNRSQVYIYDPGHQSFPWYIGGSVIDPSRLIDEYPTYPARAFIVHGDATFDIAYRLPVGTKAVSPKK